VTYSTQPRNSNLLSRHRTLALRSECPDGRDHTGSLRRGNASIATAGKNLRTDKSPNRPGFRQPHVAIALGPLGFGAAGSLRDSSRGPSGVTRAWIGARQRRSETRHQGPLCVRSTMPNRDCRARTQQFVPVR